MLSDQHRAIVKSTVPLLETGGEALTTHFYRLMLAEYPEVRPLFNQTHQATGDQPRALANSVLAYARHIDDLTPLKELVGRIVNKHVGLQIQPAHYPIVGTCLLRAIREVLGPDIATDAVLQAWGAAYQELASLLIEAEEQCYAAQEKAPGGWRGTRSFRVVRKEPESAEITSFYLAPTDGGPLPDFQPGQYIGLQVQIGDAEYRRNYSLSAAPNGVEYRISVKRQNDGVVSNHLHDRVREGDTLALFPPSGNFTLQESDKPLVLISGGVGITPTLAMLQAALGSPRPIYFIHCARNNAVHAFRNYVEKIIVKFPQVRRFYCYDEHGGTGPRPDAVGYLTKEQLAQWLPRERDVDVYFLGPKPFMSNVKRYLKELEVPEAQTRYEFFGPAAAL